MEYFYVFVIYLALHDVNSLTCAYSINTCKIKPIVKGKLDYNTFYSVERNNL